MKKRRYYEVKQDAKLAMSGKMGEAILAALILPIAFSIVISTIGTGFDRINPFLTSILNPFFTAVTTYFVLRIIIKISRYKHDQMFSNFFGSKKGILASLGVAIFFAIPTIAIFAIHWDIISQFLNIFADISANPELYADPVYMEEYMNNIILNYSPSIAALVATFVIGIISIIMAIRLRFAAYIVADSDLDFLSAIKNSWKYTKGNFFRILFFPLSFILWSFVVLITCGLAIIYVTPYMAIAEAALYNALLKENGVEFDDGLTKPVTISEGEEVTLEDKDKDPLEEKDVFEDYYK